METGTCWPWSQGKHRCPEERAESTKGKRISRVNPWLILYGLKGNLHGNDKWIFEPSSGLFACLWSPVNKFGFILIINYTLQMWKGVALLNNHTGTGHPDEINQDHCTTADELNADPTWAIGVLGVSSWRGTSRGQSDQALKYTLWGCKMRTQMMFQ